MGSEVEDVNAVGSVDDVNFRRRVVMVVVRIR